MLYPRNEKLDKIMKKCKDNLKLNENERTMLIEDVGKYKTRIAHLENQIDNIGYEYEYRSNKNRSYTKRLISIFPCLYMIPKIPKIGIKNTLINRKGYHAIKDSQLLDIGYYLKNNRDVKSRGDDPILHYIYHGFKEGRKPNPEFDGEYYLETHSDVRKSNLNPLIHYALFGINEKRKPGQNFRRYAPVKIKSGKISGIIRYNMYYLALDGHIDALKDSSPREVILKIDEHVFNIKCDADGPYKENNRVDDDVQYFKFNIPPQFINGEEYRIRLYDTLTGVLIASPRMTFLQNRRYKDLAGFLRNSLVSPMVYAPFIEQDKRCFATMENITKCLINLSDEKKESPLVSVIMPVYNSVKTIQRAIDSVLNQTYSNVELIIIDFGSDDGSIELLEKIEDSNVIILQNKACMNVATARNTGLITAKGKYITYLDSDSTWDSRYVAAMVGAFSKLKDADAVYSGQLLFMEDQEQPFAVCFGSLNRSLLENRNYIDLNAICHTNDLYKDTGGFDESLGDFADWDWIMEISRKAQIYSIPVLLSNVVYKNDQELKNIKQDDYLLLREKQAKRQMKTKAIRTTSQTLIKTNVSVIIPSYESLDDITECINSIMSLNAGEWLEIIVVDNASSPLVLDYLSELYSNGDIKLIKNNINYGFTYAVNQGISIAEPGNDILIMNNDAMVTPGAIETMQEAAYELSDCGIVVPQQVLPMESNSLVEHVPYADPEYECDVNLSFIHTNMINLPLLHSGRVVELNFAPFFCGYIKNIVLENSVGLDAEFGRHYRSDRIFCNYIRHVMKLKIYHISNSVVYHKVQKATDILRENSKEDYDIILIMNQWDDELASKLGYKKPLWDF